MIYLYQLREILTNLIIKKLFKKYLKKVLTLKSIFDIIKTVKESQTLTN